LEKAEQTLQNRVTELESQLATKEKQLAELINHIPMSVAMFNTNVEYIAANKKWMDGYGLGDRNIIGVSHYDIFPEIGDDWKEIHRNCLAGEVNINERAPFPRADGSLDWIRWDVRPWYDPNGDIGGLLMYTDVITEQVQAERELKTVENRYEALIRQNPDVIAVLNRDREILYVNGMPGQDDYRYNAEDLSSEILLASYAHFMELKDENDSDAPGLTKAQFDSVFDEQKVITFEAPGLGRDGFVTWFTTRIIPIFQEDEVVAAGIISTDIGDLKKAQQDLEVSEERLRTIIQALPDLYFMFDKDGIYLDVKDGDDLYVPREQIIGKSARDLLPPEIGKKTMALVKEVYETGESRVFEYDLDMPNGTLSYEARMYKVADRDEILAFVRDMTERKQAEKDLATSEERFRTIVNALPDLYFMFDKDGIYLDMKDSDQLLAPREELLGKPIDEVIPGELGKNYKKMIHGVVETGEPKIFEYDLDVPIGKLSYEARMYKAAEEENEALLFVRDITERKQAEKERERLIRQLEDAILFKDQFLATMSHELRTPMNAIMGYTGISLTRDGVPDNVRNMLERTDINARRLLGLINNVLDISRINASRVQLVNRPMNLKTVSEGWHSDFMEQAKKKKLGLNYAIAPDVPEIIIADEERLSQIVGNLLTNAIKFTETGEVSLNLSAKDDQLIIKVHDTGIGIPETWQHLVFEEFRQVDSGSRRKYGGAGLGLSIVQKLCNIMGGSVRLESELGKGSTFIVKLPLVTEETATSTEKEGV